MPHRGHGNHEPSDLQSLRSRGHPRGPSSTRGKKVPARSGQHLVALAPKPVVGSNTFTWERAEATQCAAYTPYALSAAGPERAYFTPLLAAAVVNVAKASPPAQVLPLLDAAARALEHDESALSIRTIEYGQLMPISNPDLSQRAPPANDPSYVPATDYEEYVGTHRGKESQRMVQAPGSEGGRHYWITCFRNWIYNLTLTATLKLDDFEDDQDGSVCPDIHYAAQFTLKKRGKAHCYEASDKVNDLCIFVAVGEIHESLDAFKAWTVRNEGPNKIDAVAYQSQTLMEKIFYQYAKGQYNWPRAVAAYESDADSAAQEVLERAVDVGSRCRFNLEKRNGCMVYFVKEGGSEESEWMRVCNFLLERFEGLYNFNEDDHGWPFCKVVCRVILDLNGEGIYYLPVDQMQRSPALQGYYALDVECMIQTHVLKTTSDLDLMFTKHHALLRISTMTPDMLRCWLAEQPIPPVTSCIVRFGRQLDGAFVSGNLAFRQNKLMTHSEAGVCIVPSYFHEGILPLPKADYPYNIVIPQCHVRYLVGHLFYNHLMPKLFLNNTMQARATFAAGVMGLYASMLWDGGSGFGHGCSITWLYSPEPGTVSSCSC